MNGRKEQPIEVAVASALGQCERDDREYSTQLMRLRNGNRNATNSAWELGNRMSSGSLQLARCAANVFVRSYSGVAKLRQMLLDEQGKSESLSRLGIPVALHKDVVSALLSETHGVMSSFASGIDELLGHFSSSLKCLEPVIVLRQIRERMEADLHAAADGSIDNEQHGKVQVSRLPHPPVALPDAAAIVEQSAPIVTSVARECRNTPHIQGNKVAAIHRVGKMAQEILRSHDVARVSISPRQVVRNSLFRRPNTARTLNSNVISRIHPTSTMDRPPTQPLKIQPAVPVSEVEARAARLLAVKIDTELYRKLSIEEKQIIHDFEQRELRFHHEHALLNMRIVASRVKARRRSGETSPSSMRAVVKLQTQKTRIAEGRLASIYQAELGFVRLKRQLPKLAV